MDVDWGAVQVKYEMLGYSIADLAEEHGMSKDAIKHVIKSKGWHSNDTSAKITCTDPEEYLPALTKKLTTEFNILALLNQVHVRPKYIAIEHALLEKMAAAVNAIDANETSAVTKIKNLVCSFKELTGNSGSPIQPESTLEDIENESDNFMEMISEATTRLNNKKEDHLISKAIPVQ